MSELEKYWKETMATFNRSMIPDHTQGVLELLKILKKENKELKFKLKALSNFVYHHHHKILYEKQGVSDTWVETSKAKVWVDHPNGMKEEPSDKE